MTQMSRVEMLEAVKRLLTAEGSEQELNNLVLALDDAAPGSRITDLIYHSDEELTPEEIVDTALARVGTWDD